MVTTFRAILAFGLLAGFYALVAVVLGLTVLMGYLALEHPSGGTLKLAVVGAFIAFALIGALWRASRTPRGDEPGIPVSPHQEPMLWETVGELAQRVQTRPPDEIRLVPEVNAAVSEETAMLGLRAKRRRMYIGMPLLITFTVAEMRAVLGHELGHYSGAHTRLGAPVYRGRVSLLATVAGLRNHPMIQRLFAGYAKLYLRISQAVSRRQELEADEFAVAISGRGAAASALRKVHGTAPAWDFFTESYLGLAGPARARPADLFGGFHALISEPARQREMAEAADAPEERSPYDSHPSLPERLNAIARLPEPGAAPDPRPAVSLLQNPAAAARAVQDSMWTDQARQLPEKPWEEIVAAGMYGAANAEAATDLARAGQAVVGAQEPYLDAALEAFARGQAQAVHVHLIKEGWTDEPGMPAHVLARALEAALIEHGLARWVLSWASSSRLLDRSGNEINLDEFAKAVIADPARQVPVLRDWLARSGIAPAYRPGVWGAGARA